MLLLGNVLNEWVKGDTIGFFCYINHIFIKYFYYYYKTWKVIYCCKKKQTADVNEFSFLLYRTVAVIDVTRKVLWYSQGHGKTYVTTLRSPCQSNEITVSTHFAMVLSLWVCELKQPNKILNASSSVLNVIILSCFVWNRYCVIV